MRMSVPSVKHLTPACRELFCGLLKVIVTEAEKLLLDWTPPTTCPFFWPKINSGGGGLLRVPMASEELESQGGNTNVQ